MAWIVRSFRNIMHCDNCIDSWFYYSKCGNSMAISFLIHHIQKNILTTAKTFTLMVFSLCVLWALQTSSLGNWVFFLKWEVGWQMSQLFCPNQKCELWNKNQAALILVQSPLSSFSYVLAITNLLVQTDHWKFPSSFAMLKASNMVLE